MIIEVGVDRLNQVGNTVEHTPASPFVSDVPDPTLDQIHFVCRFREIVLLYSNTESYNGQRLSRSSGMGQLTPPLPSCSCPNNDGTLPRFYHFSMVAFPT